MAVQRDWDEFIWQMAWSVKQGSREETRRYADFFKACVDEDVAARVFEEIDKEDVTDLLPRVASPTLVIAHMEARTIPAHLGRALAAAIPGAEFLGLQGIVTDETDRILAAAARFIGSNAGVGSQLPQRGGAGGTCTILWTDLVNHSAMMHRLGDAAGRELLREHERITRDLLAQYGGSEVKTMGDGFLASFGRATGAVECAIALQRAFAERNESAATGQELRVRVGLNAGEPIEDEGDLFGATVILASRIASQAGPGDILVPEPVRHLVAGKGFAFSDRGEFVPKGFDDAVRLLEVRWGD
jgi:class 3 adenylate cyclase